MINEYLFQPLLFVIAVGFLFYIPGTLLQQAMGGGQNVGPNYGLSETALRLALGVVAMPVLYQLMRRVGISDFFMLALILPIVAYGVYRFRQIPRSAWDKDSYTILVFAILFSCLLLWLSHFADFGVSGDVTWYKTTLLTESTFHQGLINALKDSIPPPALYAAGASDFSSYHLNMHLQIEGINRITGIATDRLVFWYFPLLYFLLLFLLPVAFVRRQGGATVPAVVAGMLVFGTGFSFLPGLAGMADPSFVWNLFFHADNYGLFTLNGLLPGLIALFVVLLAFPSDQSGLGRGYWWVMALLMIGAYGFKSSIGTQIAGTFLAVGAIRLVTSRDISRDWRMPVCGLVALSFMFAEQAFFRQGLGESFVEFRYWNVLDGMLSRFGLADVQTAFKPMCFVVFLLGGLGVRVLGFATLKGSLQQRPENIWLVLFILIFVLGGYVLPDALYLGDSTYQFNHATWFAVQGLFASWFLLFLYLARLNADKTTHALILGCLLVFSLPSTAQLLWLKRDSGVAIIGPDEQQLVGYLESTDPSSIIMHPLNLDGPSLASNLAGRSSVLNVHKSFVNETQGLGKRVQGVRTFFGADTEMETRQAILDYYGVTHVYAPHEFDAILANVPRLERVMSNGRYSVWKVVLQ